MAELLLKTAICHKAAEPSWLRTPPGERTAHNTQLAVSPVLVVCQFVVQQPLTYTSVPLIALCTASSCVFLQVAVVRGLMLVVYSFSRHLLCCVSSLCCCCLLTHCADDLLPLLLRLLLLLPLANMHPQVAVVGGLMLVVYSFSGPLGLPGVMDQSIRAYPGERPCAQTACFTCIVIAGGRLQQACRD